MAQMGCRAAEPWLLLTRIRAVTPQLQRLHSRSRVPKWEAYDLPTGRTMGPILGPPLTSRTSGLDEVGVSSQPPPSTQTVGP